LDVLIGFLNTGPSPSKNSTPKPKASGIVKISENRIDASKLNAFIG
jgi:hypothetical protein